MLLRRVISRARGVLGLPQPLEPAQILDRALIVRRGTVRSTPDYDDAWLFACAQHARNVVDVGSNIGQAAVLMLAAGYADTIVLVEANPQALIIASENVIRNFASLSVHLVCAFAGGSDGETVQFWTVGTGAAGSINPEHAKTAKKRNSSYSIPMITLDKIVVGRNMTPDLVKIDVEGAESDVLKGCKGIMGQQQTRFFVEMHSNGDMRKNAETVLAWCIDNNYRAWYMAKHVELTSPEQISHRGRCHLLLQPRKWAYPEWLQGIEQGSAIQLGRS